MKLIPGLLDRSKRFSWNWGGSSGAVPGIIIQNQGFLGFGKKGVRISG
jgi:hypothetical protein